ncbi:OmpA family protein, partial [Klebsiella quasipneumoniae]|nr:OmpA family protein [Klebsiella quasipneumoniae]
MRRTVIISVALHTLAAVAALLWLLWYFIPTGNVFNGLSTLLILVLAGWYVFKNCWSEEPTFDVTLSAAELPLTDAQGPVVLVCGDMLEALFQGGPLRKTAQGWWLRAGDVNRLTDVVRSIQTQFPRQVGQLSVMCKRAARTVLTGMCYSVGSATRQGSSS